MGENTGEWEAIAKKLRDLGCDVQGTSAPDSEWKPNEMMMDFHITYPKAGIAGKGVDGSRQEALRIAEECIKPLNRKLKVLSLANRKLAGCTTDLNYNWSHDFPNYLSISLYLRDPHSKT